MDVYSEQSEQDASGQIKRVWDVDNPEAKDVACIARGISGGGIRVVGSIERFSQQHEDVEYVKIQTKYRITKRHRIGNIRGSKNRDGTRPVAWYGDDGGPLIFNVLGVTTTFDPYGKVMEYDILVKMPQVNE